MTINLDMTDEIEQEQFRKQEFENQIRQAVTNYILHTTERFPIDVIIDMRENPDPL
jgi:hypothetical protein